MALDMLYETEVLGRSVSAANRRTDLFELVRVARRQRDQALTDAVTDTFSTAATALGGVLTKIAYAIEGWRKRRATFGELMQLDDRLLSDIGIHRADIPAITEAATVRRLDGEGAVFTSGVSTRAV